MIKKNDIETQITILLLKEDKKAISLLYKHYSPALYGIISRIILEKEIANEVLQDTFVKIWKNSSKYDITKGKLFTWMAQIARNSAIDTIRSGKYQRSTKTDSLPEYVYNSKQLSESINVNDSGLKTQIDKMDLKYREVIDLIYFQGYSQSEAAKQLDLPLGTIKTRIRKAIIELRKSLGNEVLTLFVLISFAIITILAT